MPNDDVVRLLGAQHLALRRKVPGELFDLVQRDYNQDALGELVRRCGMRNMRLDYSMGGETMLINLELELSPTHAGPWPEFRLPPDYESRFQDLMYDSRMVGHVGVDWGDLEPEPELPPKPEPELPPEPEPEPCKVQRRFLSITGEEPKT